MLAVGNIWNYSPEAGHWFIFILANSTRECRERLARMLCCAQGQDVQFLLGLSSWSNDMFDLLPQVDLEHPSSIGQVFSSYIGVARTSARTDLYVGSCTGTYLTKYGIGTASRMYQGHYKCLTECLEARKLGKDPTYSGVFDIHKRMALPGTTALFTLLAQYPVTRGILGLLRTLSLVAENCNCILLSSIAPSYVPKSSNTCGQAFWLFSSTLVKALRPDGLPDAPWHGTNKCLPMLQSQTAIVGLFQERSRLGDTICDTTHVKLVIAMVDFWKATGALRLTRDDVETLKQKVGLDGERDVRDPYRNLYARVLEEQGQRYQSVRAQKLEIHTTMWHGIIRHAEEVGLYDGPHEGVYRLRPRELDWDRVAQIARNSALHAADIYTKENCHLWFHRSGNKSWNRMYLYEYNWTRLTGKRNIL